MGGFSAMSLANNSSSVIDSIVNSVNQRPEVYAHRGGTSYMPENTIPAYTNALAIGVEWVDMDIGITKDGLVVVYHHLWLNPDTTKKNCINLNKMSKADQIFCKAKDSQSFYTGLEKTKGGIDVNIQPFLIKNFTFSELQQYNVGWLNPYSSYAKFFPEQAKIAKATIPTLQEVIAHVDRISNKQVKFQIEVKYDPSHPDWTVSREEFVDKLYAILKKNNLIKRSEIQAFDWQILFDLQEKDPNIKTAYLVSQEDVKRMNSRNEQQASLWSGGKLLKDYKDSDGKPSLPHMIKALGGHLYEPEDVALTKKDLDVAQQLGLKVVVWTSVYSSGKAFDPKMVAKLIDWGVDGIITDDPVRLNNMLEEMDLPTPNKYQTIIQKNPKLMIKTDTDNK